jgi:hypothetical protein
MATLLDARLRCRRSVPDRHVLGSGTRLRGRAAGEPPWERAEREQVIRAKVAQLVASGARIVREEHCGEHLDHGVILDPEGNEFCVA